MKVPVHNPSRAPMYVRGVMIPAGETKHIDEELVPAHLRPKPPEPEPEALPPDPIAELLKRPVKEIAAALPQIPLDGLEALRAGELASELGSRKTLLAAIEEEFLNRAIAAEEAGDAEAAARIAAASSFPGAQG